MNVTDNKVAQLEQLIIHHKALYYGGTPQISDNEYDKIEEELRQIKPDSLVLELVGNIVTSIDKVKHNSKMLSLGKTYKTTELTNWVKSHEVVSMYKIDGVSCSVIYEDGIFKMAKTRGDGTYGENISSKALWISTIPKTIKNLNCEIRGEIFCREEDFFHLSNEMHEKNLDRPTSQRNIVAGLISRKDHLELCRHIEFKAFDIIIESDNNLKTEMDKYHFMKECGFNVLNIDLHKDQKSIENAIEDSRLFMSEGSYQIDGLVFVYNDLAIHRELGETAHHPRYKMAFKFEGETKETIIKEIVWSVSRNGILTPVANIEDTQISGAIISRVTLHNYGMVKQYNLKKGDKIEIIRSGEVIPKFVRVVEESTTNNFLVPEFCPSCSCKVEINDIRLICTNTKCPAVIKESILNFIQKIGIDDLSSKRLDEMLKAQMVSSIPDLYKLTIDDLLKLDKVKDKLATKLITSISKSKDTDLVTFLSSLGISGGAYNKCEKVVFSGYNTIDKIKAITIEKLMSIDSFAQKSSVDFYNSLTSLFPLIDNLLSLGFKFVVTETSQTLVTGKKICITGSLSTGRANVETLIRSLGGIITSSVTKKTDFLLTNDTSSTSSKFKKAQDLGIEIINEEFLSKIQK